MTPGDIGYSWPYGQMAAGCASAAAGGGADPLRRARVRADHRRGDRGTRRADQADVLPLLRGQARGAVLGFGGTGAADGGRRRGRPRVRLGPRRDRRGTGCRRRPVRGVPRVRRPAPPDHRLQSRAAGTRADQGRVAGLRPGPGPAGPGTRGHRRHPGRPHLHDRHAGHLRAMGRRPRPHTVPADRPGCPGPAPGDRRGRLTRDQASRTGRGAPKAFCPGSRRRRGRRRRSPRRTRSARRCSPTRPGRRCRRARRTR
jgi:hypothetical protein